jgi:hypothetical protein
MGMKNEDPNDLALGAKVTASSHGTLDDARAPHGGTIHDMDAARATMFTAKTTQLEGVEVYLRSKRAEPVSVRLTLCAANKLGDFSSGQALASAEAQVAPGSAGWLRFDLSSKLVPGQFYYVWLPATEGLQWDLYATEMKGTARAYGVPKWHTMTHCYRHRLVPGGEPISEDGFASTYQLLPENVVNGWNRAVHGVPNSWAPDARQPGPHWIELDFGQPAAINEVHVTFQLPNMAAEAYDLAAPAGQDWRTVCTVHGNNQRRRVHRFDRIHASRLRLTLKGDLAKGKPVRLCEIRVYGK